MQKVISFNKKGYDPFLDFIKAYAIICVLMGHTFPYLHETGYSLWYGMQVPLFVLVQVFHVYKKESYSFDFKKLFYRIFLPFFVIQLIPILYRLSTTNDYKSFIINTLIGGGIGPGSYYPWLYLQLAIVIPLIKPLFSKGSLVTKTIVALLICEGFEILESVLNVPDSIHRLLAIRYFFLIFLGWLWVEKGIMINWKTIILSLLSLATIIYFEYFYIPTEPWFYDTAWRAHRWPCYFYVSTLLSAILYWVYSHIRKHEFLFGLIQKTAMSSYEIFLIQMVAIVMLPYFSITNISIVDLGVRVFIIFLVSIIGGYYLHVGYSNLLTKIKQ